MTDYRHTPWDDRLDSEAILLGACADSEDGLTVSQLHVGAMTHLRRTGVHSACHRLWERGFLRAWLCDAPAGGRGRPAYRYTITASGKRRLAKRLKLAQ